MTAKKTRRMSTFSAYAEFTPIQLFGKPAPEVCIVDFAVSHPLCHFGKPA